MKTLELVNRRAHAQDEQDVLNAVLEMTRSFHNKDLEGVMGCFADQALVSFQAGLPTGDENEMRKNFEQFFAINPHFEYGAHEVMVQGDLAIHYAPWTMTGMAPDGTEIKQSGLSTAVLRKQSDGKWLMVFDNPYSQHLWERHQQ